MKTNAFFAETNTLTLEINASKTRFQTSATYTHTASYKQTLNRPYVEMITTHRYSSPKMRQFHALVLTSEYASPTSYTQQ